MTVDVTSIDGVCLCMRTHGHALLWICSRGVQVSWLGHQTCKNRRPYNLYCVGADVKPCSINQSISAG